MPSTTGLDADLQSALERRGLSVRFVVDSAARHLILVEDIEDALDGYAGTGLLTAANDNSVGPKLRLLLAV